MNYLTCQHPATNKANLYFLFINVLSTVLDVVC